MIENIELEKAEAILEERIPCLSIEKINIIEAHKMVLAEDVFSQIDQPPFNRSPLDGYAFKAEDSELVGKHNPIKLKVIGEVYAGFHFDEEVLQGTAVRIMTGAPIPKGANCVIKQEEVNVQEDYIEISTKLSPWQNICFQGEDVKKGNLILKKDTVLKYAQIGMLASIGVTQVAVYKKPKIGILSTGDELVPIGHKLILGKIYNGNLYCLYARIKELYCEPISIGTAGDNNEAIYKKVKEGLEKSDILITTGGVSVGKKDLIKDVMIDLGAEPLFWKVKIKPGSPVFCSYLNKKLIISLSGNPAAAITTFELLVRPLIGKITGRQALNLQKTTAVLKQNFNKKSPTRRFIMGQLLYTKDGTIVNLTRKDQGNGILSSTINSNCFIDVPAKSSGLSKGQVVQVILI